MNDRERFLRTMHFEELDRVPYWELWYWEDTLKRWYNEGLPRDVNLAEYFGVDRREDIGVNLKVVPHFEETTIEESGEYRIFIRTDGVTCKEFKGRGKSSMPHWIDYPIKNRDDWNEFKRKLNPNSLSRYPAWWGDRKKTLAQRDYPVKIEAGSLYGWLRNWIGVERFSMMFYDEPDFVHEMMDYITEFVINTIHRALDDVKIDYACLWEDMSYKTGSLLSPRMFKEFMMPRYKKITGLLREHGVDIIFIDSDGDINELIPLWFESGINGMYPLEVAGGMDTVKLRKKYGKDILLIGGIDKRALAKGKEAIDKELLYKLPFLFTKGGYIPWVDHLIPPDVSFENYMYYLNLMKKISLNPEKYL